MNVRIRNLWVKHTQIKKDLHHYYMVVDHYTRMIEASVGIYEVGGR